MKIYGASRASDHHPERNEDAYFVHEMGIMGVFDGIGGNPGSEEAAIIGARSTREFLSQTGSNLALGQVASRMVRSLHIANEQISLVNAERIKSGLYGKLACTAIIAGIFTDEGQPYVHMAHAGDSRGMLYRNGKIIASTLDHAAVTQHLPRDEQERVQESLAEAMYLSDLDPYDLPFARQRNIVGQCLDGSDKLETSYFMTETMPQDVVLLSSDGIHDNLTKSEIETILATHSAEIPELLIDAALTRSREPKEKHTRIDDEEFILQLLRPKADDMTATAILL